MVSLSQVTMSRPRAAAAATAPGRRPRTPRDPLRAAPRRAGNRSGRCPRPGTSPAEGPPGCGSPRHRSPARRAGTAPRLGAMRPRIGAGDTTTTRPATPRPRCEAGTGGWPGLEAVHAHPSRTGAPKLDAYRCRYSTIASRGTNPPGRHPCRGPGRLRSSSASPGRSCPTDLPGLANPGPLQHHMLDPAGGHS